MTQQVIVSTNEGTSLSQTLANILAYGVTVDNLSSSWLFLPDAGRFIPPWTASFSTPLVGTKSAVASWSSPTGVSVPATGTGKATLTFTDYSVPFSPGVVVTQAQPTTGSAATVSVQPPPNLSFAALLSNPIAPNGNATIVAGVAGQNIYIYGWLWDFAPAQATAGQYFVGISSTAGAQLDESVYTLAAGATTMAPASIAVSLPGIIKLPTGIGIQHGSSASSAGNVSISTTVFYLQF